MADLASSSLTSRPVPPTEAAGRVGRVVSPTAAASDHAASQHHDPQTEGRQAPREDTLRAGHHDPAVTLAATLAQVEAGALLTAALQGMNSEGRPVATAGTTQYQIDADPQLLPRVLSALAEAGNATILVAGVDRTITALLIAVDGKPLPTSLPVTLTVLMTDPGTEGIEPPPNVTQAATITYRPAPTFTRQEDIDNVFMPVPAISHGSPHGAPHGSALVEKTSTIPSDGQPLPRVNTGLSLLADEQANPQRPPTPQVTITTFPSVLLPPQASGNGVPVSATHQAIDTPARPVIVTIIPLASQPTSKPDPLLTLQDMAQDLPGVVEDQPAKMPSITGMPDTPQVIRTTLGAIPLPPEVTLPQNTTIMVRLTPASMAPASPFLDTNMPPLGSATSAAHAPALRPTPAIAPLAASLTPWPDDALPEPHQPWPLMQSLLAASAADPAFSAAIVSKLPSPERPINPIFLLFLNLLGVSSPAKLLLGPGGDAWYRQNGAEEMLTRLHNGIEQLKRVAADRAAGEWRPFVIPFHNPQNPQGIESMLMLVRHSHADPNQDQSQSDAAPDDNNGRVTRFVLDLQLSRLGATQIDGIIQDKTFNLAIRTERPLTTAHEQDLRGIFTLALDRNKFTGGISFRPGLPFPVDSAREWHAALKTGSVLSA